MIGPVSGTGRAMMASLQQAVQKGMPPDQAIQYVKSMATQGVAPMTDLYAMMNQFQRLKQPQAQAPQTPPTIKDQLNMMEQQQRMQSGIAGMQAPAPAAQPMDRGLGAIDAGRMEYPQFAGGGVVALAVGGEPDLETQVQRILEKPPMLRTAEENEILRSAGRELSRRELSPDSGIARLDKYLRSPFIREGSGLPYASEQELAAAKGTGAINERIARMFGAEQKIRPAPPAVVRPESALPTRTATTPYGSFDQAMNVARVDSFGRPVRQDNVSTAATSDRRALATTGGGGRDGAKDRFSELRKGVEERKFEEIADTFSPEERKRLDKALAGLTAEKKDAIRMSLAEAAFRWAAASSRGGRERTTALGALSEGAIGGMQQYRAAQKELRQTERELGREMAELRKYQDQVARGERTAKRDFEEKKQRDILDLEKQAEQIRQFNAQLAENRRSAELQYGGREALEKYRTSTVALDALKAQLEDARENVKNLRISFAKPEQIAAAEAEVARIRGMLGQFAGGGSGVPLTGGSRQYPGFTATTLP